MPLEERLWATTDRPRPSRSRSGQARQMGSRRLVGLLTALADPYAGFVDAAPGARELPGDREGVGTRPRRALDPADSAATTSSWSTGRRAAMALGMLRAPADVRGDRARRADRRAGARGRRRCWRTRSGARSSPWPSPTELPVSRALELEGRVPRRPSAARLDALVVNGVLPGRLSAADVDRLATGDGAVAVKPLVTAARRRHGQATAQQGQLRRLRRHAVAPRDHAALRGRTAPRAGRGADARRRAGAAARWLIPRPPCPHVRGPWMPGAARRRGAVPVAPAPFGGWRSGAAERVQAGAGVVESAI